MSEIVIALRRATELGPWEPEVLEQVIRVGKLRYQALSPDVRLLVDSAIARANKLGLNT